MSKNQNTLLVGIHQLQVENSAEKTFQAAFSSNIVQVFLWNNHLYLQQAKMQSIYNNLINGFKASLSKNEYECRLFVIHADYLMQFVSDKESVRTKSTEDYSVMNTIAYNLQKFIKSYENPHTGKKCNTQVAINVHLPAKLCYDKVDTVQKDEKTQKEDKDNTANKNNKIEKEINKDRMRQFLTMVYKHTSDNILVLFENVSKTDFSDYLVSYIQAKYYLSKSKPQFKKNIGMTLDTAHIVGSGYSLQDVEYIFDKVKSKNMLGTDIRNEVRLIHMNGNEKSKSSKQDKHLSIFDKNDTVFKGDINKVKKFVEYVKTNFKKCYGFILERNDLTFDENEQKQLEKII